MTQTMAAQCNTCIIQLSNTAAFMLGSVGGTILIPMAPNDQHKDCGQQAQTCKQKENEETKGSSVECTEHLAIAWQSHWF